MYEVFNWNAEPPKRFSLSIIGHEINIDEPPAPVAPVPAQTTLGAVLGGPYIEMCLTTNNASSIANVGFTNDVNMHFSNSGDYSARNISNHNNVYATTTAFQIRQYLIQFIFHYITTLLSWISLFYLYRTNNFISVYICIIGVSFGNASYRK